MTAIRAQIAGFRFVLRHGLSAYRGRAAVVAAVAILHQATGVGLAILLGLMVESTTGHSRERVLLVSAAATVLVMVTQGAFIAGYFSRVRLGEEVEHRLENELIAAVGGTPTIEVHERPGWRDRVAAVRDARADVGQCFDTVMVLTGAVVLLVVSAILLATIVPVLAALPLFAVPTLLATRRAEDRRGEAVTRARPMTRLADHLFGLVTTAAPAREVRLFGQADELLRRHRAEWDRGGRGVVRAEGRAQLLVALAWLLFVLAYGSAALLIVRAGIDGDASLGQIVTALAVTAQISGQVQMLLNWAFWVLEAVRGAASYRDVIQHCAQEKQAGTPAEPAPTPDRLATGITLSGLGFRYGEQSEPALSNVTVHWPAGTVVALLGENGAGKSTLVKLLAGLYRPTEGAILVDGTDLARFDPDEWRRRITASFQDLVPLELTVQDSVGIGALEHRDDSSRVLESLRRVGAEELLASLPTGLTTRLGHQSWDGRELSGGQWQTLANARAAMRRCPLVRILDEPTASLDARAEEVLFRQYAELGRLEGGVTVLVTHRFTTARAADLIVVLDRGRLAEIGDHETLRRSDGLYAELFEVQARYFV
jgi:ATP-binding cassette subfamily B protein